MKAIKWSHFLAQPIDIPLIFWEENPFGLTGNFSAEINDRQSWRSAPDAPEFVDAGCCHDKIVFVRKSEWVK
jgi:hypothetical protein